MSDLVSIPHEKSDLRFEMPSSSAAYADRDHFFWTAEMVQVYLVTRRVMWQGRIWERRGVCNRCGECCRWKNPLTSEMWAASFPRLEAAVEKGEYPAQLSLVVPYAEGNKHWCRNLRFSPTQGQFHCVIWDRYGYFGLPDICAVEPCTPRLDQDPNWAEEYPNCSLRFEDVTELYLDEGNESPGCDSGLCPVPDP